MSGKRIKLNSFTVVGLCFPFFVCSSRLSLFSCDSRSCAFQWFPFVCHSLYSFVNFCCSLKSSCYLCFLHLAVAHLVLHSLHSRSICLMLSKWAPRMQVKFKMCQTLNTGVNQYTIVISKLLVIHIHPIVPRQSFLPFQAQASTRPKCDLSAHGRGVCKLSANLCGMVGHVTL